MQSSRECEEEILKGEGVYGLLGLLYALDRGNDDEIRSLILKRRAHIFEDIQFFIASYDYKHLLMLFSEIEKNYDDYEKMEVSEYLQAKLKTVLHNRDLVHILVQGGVLLGAEWDHDILLLLFEEGYIESFRMILESLGEYVKISLEPFKDHVLNQVEFLCMREKCTLEIYHVMLENRYKFSDPYELERIIFEIYLKYHAYDGQLYDVFPDLRQLIAFVPVKTHMIKDFLYWSFLIKDEHLDVVANLLNACSARDLIADDDLF